MKRLRLTFIIVTLAAGCGSGDFDGASSLSSAPPLALQQARAYPETVTGLFVPLADFETALDSPRPGQQVQDFAINPLGADAACRFVYNVSATGAGAMEVMLSPGSELVYMVGGFQDFGGYNLLSMALRSQTLRDDLVVTIDSDSASWSSHRMLLLPGWNTVLVDIAHLGGRLDLANVRSIRIGFAEAAGPVVFHLDDIMLLANTRWIEPVPPGMTLRKEGLDYTLALEGQKLHLRQDPAGLWRLSRQPVIQLAAENQLIGDADEHLELMGARRLGKVELLEHNALRVRLASTWYFPDRAGEWLSLAVRQVRWEHTFYADGRWVSCLEINGAGSTHMARATVLLDEPAAWAGGAMSDRCQSGRLPGGAGRWSFLQGYRTLSQQQFQAYLQPGRVERKLCQDAFAAGDGDKDGFDESQGCYNVTADKSGGCRFTIHPPPGGLQDAVILVKGPWRGSVTVSAQGRPIRQVVRLDDGVLFRLDALERPTAVEVAGRALP